MLTAVLLVLAQPGDVVQVHDFGKMTWQQAKALEGRRVRVRFTVASFGQQADFAMVFAASQGGRTSRAVALSKCGRRVLTRGTRLEAEGVLQVALHHIVFGEDDRFIVVTLDDARLVK
jgi:hypothetical protein